MTFQTAGQDKYAVKLTYTTRHSLGSRGSVAVWGIGRALGQLFVEEILPTQTFFSLRGVELYLYCSSKVCVILFSL